MAGVTAGTKDHTIVRKSSVQSGNGGDWITSAGTDAENSEWIVLDQNDWTNLAMHTFDGWLARQCLDAPTPMPPTTMRTPPKTTGGCMFDNVQRGRRCGGGEQLPVQPANLTIEPGQTVVVQPWWHARRQRRHRFSNGFFLWKPEGFYLAPVAGDAAECIGSYTQHAWCTYDCSIGSHAALGMVATVTVGTGGCTNAAAANYNRGRLRRRFMLDCGIDQH